MAKNMSDEEQDLSEFYADYSPGGPIACLVLALLGLGTVLALIAEFTRKAGH